MIDCRPCLILLLHDDKLERGVADVGEFMPRGRRNIRQCSRHGVDLADAFLILNLGLAAAHYVTEVRRVRVADVHCAGREGAACDKYLGILEQLFTGVVALPLD